MVLLDRLLAFLTVVWPSIANALKGAFIAYMVRQQTQQAMELHDAQRTLEHAEEANKIERALDGADAGQLDDVWLRVDAARKRAAG